MSWIDSPACLTVRFEELYSELTQNDSSNSTSPVLDSICDYLDLPRKPPSELAAVIGRGLTSSKRLQKIGAYRSRMTPHHLDLISSETFQKLVVEFGYEPTRRIVRRNRVVAKVSRGLANIRNVFRARVA